LEKLRERRHAIAQAWAALLHVERYNSALANPDTLQYLVPDTLERIFATLARSFRVPVSLASAKLPLPPCNCGHNPYRAFFIAGEQAITEAMILVQAELPAALRRESDLAAVLFTIRRHAAADIDVFCGICTHRGHARNCRFGNSSAAASAAMDLVSAAASG
jgi:hypothetical protein